MKAASVKEIKTELGNRSAKELTDIILHLSKFKKDNKEFLTYLLYEVEDEQSYINSIKDDMDDEFDEINTSSFFYIKKSVRKILRQIKKYIRYSKKKETEIELLLHFCRKMRSISPSIARSTILLNIYDRQIAAIRKAIGTLHEDLQYDYELELNKMIN